MTAAMMSACGAARSRGDEKGAPASEVTDVTLMARMDIMLLVRSDSASKNTSSSVSRGPAAVRLSRVSSQAANADQNNHLKQTLVNPCPHPYQLCSCTLAQPRCKRRHRSTSGASGSTNALNASVCAGM